MEQIIAYRSNDGTLHTNEADCMAYELAQEMTPIIDVFLIQDGNRGLTTRRTYAKLILRWEAFRRKQEGSELVGHGG